MQNQVELCFSEKIYSPNEIDEVITNYRVIKTLKAKGKEYYNFPVTFDIEASSFYYNGEKQSLMYVWTMCFNGATILGRTWDEFLYVISRFKDRLMLSTTRLLIIYVHNLAYDFQFFRKLIPWDNIFAMSKYKPLKAVSSYGIEFRCSYLLSGLSLKKVGEELQYHEVKKLVGDLDYDLLRTPITPLTDEEIGYCVNDVKVACAYIQEQINQNNNKISNIPLTKTGYVRNYCRNQCFYLEGKEHHSNKEKTKYNNYRKIMKVLTLEVDEYEQLKRAFQGGFTHANGNYSGTTMHNVASFDFSSAYPTVMICEKFPMSKGEIVEIKSQEDFEKYIRLYCCLFDIYFTDIESRYDYEHYISKSKCMYIYGNSKEEQKNAKPEDLPCFYNGRVTKAKMLSTTITDIDFNIIKKMYKWKHFKVKNFRIYKRGYLPTDFVKAILKLYKDKTELKDVEGKVQQYMVAKGMLNASFGMTVTDIARFDYFLDNEENWNKEKPDLKEAIDSYNKSAKRFLSYPWGVWITAYARQNLFTGIMECGDDYIYSDTDSIKIINYEKHMSYINNYNVYITKKLEKALDYHGIEYYYLRPKNIKGEEKQLGIWDFEGVYDDFKTLGAKRYMIYREYLDVEKKKKALKWNDKDDEVKNKDLIITIAGLSKVQGSKYLSLHTDDAFKFFNKDMKVPAEYTGKLTHTYIDEPMVGTVVDYLGQPYEYHELSGIHMCKQEYSSNVVDTYVKIAESLFGGDLDGDEILLIDEHFKE